MTDAENAKILEDLHNKILSDNCLLEKVDHNELYALFHARRILEQQNAEIERLQKQENTVAKLYHKKGVKDFAKFLIDKAKGGIIHSFDIPDYVAEMEGETDAKE